MNFLSDDVLRNHCFWQHLVDENDYSFKDLFSPDINYKSCDICMIDFNNSRMRKNHTFLLHYNQMGGNTGNQLLITVLRRGTVKYFTINYNQHKNFTTFFKNK